MTSRMLSTQQVNRRHEEKLHALEEQLNAQRMRVKTKLYEDTQRICNELIHLSIRTPSTHNDSFPGEGIRTAQSVQPNWRIANDANENPTHRKRARTDMGLSPHPTPPHASEKTAPLLTLTPSMKTLTESKHTHTILLPEVDSALPRVEEKTTLPCLGDSVKKGHKTVYPDQQQGSLPRVVNHGRVRFISQVSEQPSTSLPIVEVRGCRVQVHYKQTQGRPGQTKPFLPDSKTRTLLIRTNRISDSLSRLSQRKAGRFPDQEAAFAGGFGSNVEVQPAGPEEHDSESVTESAAEKEAPERSSSNLPTMLALKAVSSARKAFRPTVTNVSRRPSRVVPDYSGCSLTGWQLKGFYSLWITSRRSPVWATSAYLRRKQLEDRKHRRRSARPKRGVQAALLQAVSALGSAKKTSTTENDDRDGGGDGGGGGGDGAGGGRGLRAAAKLWMTSSKSGLSEISQDSRPSSGAPSGFL